jgi:thiol-disulfide isomerase/thioredoxin
MIIGVLILAMAASTGCSDDKPAKSDDRSGKEDPSFTKLRKEFEDVMEGFEKELDNSRSKEEEKAIKARNPAPGFATRFLAFAEKDPSKPEAFDALLIAFGASGGPQNKAGCWNKVMKALLRDHVKNEKLFRLVRDLAGDGEEECLSFLRAVIEKNPSRKIQGRALQSLIETREAGIDAAERFQKDEKLRANVEKVRGKEFVRKVIEDAEASKKELAELTKQLQKYADVIIDLSIGKTMPEIALEDLKGKKVKLSDLRGKVVVLDLWATWCPPCRAMIPHTTKLVERMKGKPFVFVSISGDDDKETVENFIKKNPMPWTHWFNGPDGGVVEDWNVKYFPTIFVLDTKGVIRYKDLREKELDDAVEILVRETEKK